MLGSPAVPLCDCTSLCVCERAEENAMEGEWEGGALMAGIFKNKTKKAEAKRWIPPKKTTKRWMFLF